MVLRSRGTRRDIVWLHIVQWGLLGLLALLCRRPGGVGGGHDDGLHALLPPVHTRGRGVRRAGCAESGLRGGAMGLALLAAVLPARRARRHTVVTHGQREQADRRPWWQRYGVDIVLPDPALYGYVLLQGPTQLLARLRRCCRWLWPSICPPTCPRLACTEGPHRQPGLPSLVPAPSYSPGRSSAPSPLLMAALARASRRLRSAVPLPGSTSSPNRCSERPGCSALDGDHGAGRLLSASPRSPSTAT